MRSGNTGSVDQAPPEQRSGHCPQISELSAFSRGALPLAALHSIAEHVSVCIACDSKVSTLVSDLEHRLTRVDQAADARPVASPSESGDLDLAEAHIEASAAAPVVEEEGPTAPLRLGQYRLMRQIGRGGMGVVYQARHEKLLRDVAIKFVPIETIQDLLDVQRLQREMAAAGTMRHPNVVYATDAGEAEGVHYLVMEYVEGIDLSKLVSRVGPLPVADACEIIRQAAEGLAHVEQQQLVHRDLKPSNLMLATDGTVKILDLGLARASIGQTSDHELTRNGYLLGTIDYVAPEQARDAHAADIRSDIYSLGCTFYKLLTGEAPFAAAGKSVASKILAHELQPPPPLSKQRPDVPPAIEEIVQRMLAKDPDERFQSPLELKRALKAHVAAADLPALLAKVTGSAPSSSRPPLADASRSTTIGESQVGRRSTVVSRRTAPRQTAMAIGAVAVVGLLLAGLWLGGWLPGIAGPLGGAGRRPAPRVDEILAARNRGQVDYPFPQGRPGIGGSVAWAGPGALKLESDFIQLVRLGYLRDDAKRVSFEIDQSPNWTGQVGFFLGYHEINVAIKDRDGILQRADVAEFQLLLLHHIVDTSGRSDYFRAERMRALVHPYMMPGTPYLSCELVAQSQKRIEIPGKNQTLPLLVEFSGTNLSRQIRRIVIGGVELDDLIDPRPNLQLVPRDYEGACGLFNYGDIGGATFHNFDLSHLEKE